MVAILKSALVIVLCFVAVPAGAQQAETPYWASIRVDEINMRVGPGEDYRITWVYRRPLLPLRVLRMHEGWRLVEDPDGTQGWVLGRFLSRTRTAIVSGDGLATIRQKGAEDARLLWRVEPGVVGHLGDCDGAWCRLEVAGHAGFVEARRLWGDGKP